MIRIYPATIRVCELRQWTILVRLTTKIGQVLVNGEWVWWRTIVDDLKHTYATQQKHIQAHTSTHKHTQAHTNGGTEI